jgi:preprotein translocase subunit SecB
MTTTNGGPEPAADELPQFSVVIQYIKDFSFENPNSPNSLITAKQTPKIDIQINVKANPLSDTDIEVILTIEGTAQIDEALLFGFELAFAGVFRLQNVPQESVSAIVLIECPRLLFPFAREIIATTTRNGGFPPLLLEPVDFVGLYRQKMSEMQAAGALAPEN